VLVPKVIETVRKTGLTDVGFFVGGIIPEEDVAVLKAAGVNAVYGPGTSTVTVIEDVKSFAHAA
jgi:methylmalonyl-CoA mutase C-terminal domain/subunit